MRNIYRDNRRTSWYDGIPNVPNNDTQLQLLHGRCTFGDFFVEHPENSGIPQIHVYLLESRWLDAPMYWLMLSHLLSLPCKWKKSARPKKNVQHSWRRSVFFVAGNADYLLMAIFSTPVYLQPKRMNKTVETKTDDIENMNIMNLYHLYIYICIHIY